MLGRYRGMWDWNRMENLSGDVYNFNYSVPLFLAIN